MNYNRGVFTSIEYQLLQPVYENQFEDGEQLSTEVSRMKLIDLNDDCLMHIFRYLRSEDLANVSEVCKSFQPLALTTFKSLWKDRHVFLSNISTKDKLHSTRILRNFGSSLKKVNIDFGGDRTNNKFFDVIMIKCLDLIEVEFSGFAVEIFTKVLTMRNIVRFNRKFTNLKRIRFGVLSNKLVNAECIHQTFPKLEHLSIQHPFNDLNLKKFLTLNPQLKSLELDYDFHSITRQLIGFIDDKLPHLEQLVLRDMGDRRVNNYQPKFLNNLRRLHICATVNGKFLPGLAISNKKVEELIIEADTCNNNLIDLICQYKEVKKLAFYCRLNTIRDDDLIKLSETLPKLSEVELRGYKKAFLPIQNISKFVQVSQQLTKFVLKPFTLDLLDGIKQNLHPPQWNVTHFDDTLKICKSYKREWNRI